MCLNDCIYVYKRMNVYVQMCMFILNIYVYVSIDVSRVFQCMYDWNGMFV